MNVLVLGANGMLGHRLLASLPGHGHRVVGTVRGKPEEFRGSVGGADTKIVGGITVESANAVERLIEAERPAVVLNCIGVVKQMAQGQDPLTAIPVNALFPHRVAKACADAGARLIHFSTDCVFSGRVGPYSEASPPDPADVYGRTKLLGEVNAPNALTLRTSIIGHELGDGTGFLAWVLRSKGTRVSGYARALYTGVTTDYMARAVALLISDFPQLCGVWHFASDPISKYDLLCLANEIYQLQLSIDRDETFVCDRRLDGSLLRLRTGIVPPTWKDMLVEMHANSQRSWGE